MNEPALTAERAEERGQGICRTCLAPIWNEGGTIRHRKRAEGWSDRIERGGDSLVCFKAADYRHIPLTGREAFIYDVALRRQGPITDAQVEAAAWAIVDARYPEISWKLLSEATRIQYRAQAHAALEASRSAS
jgi:hypothetical protein